VDLDLFTPAACHPADADPATSDPAFSRPSASDVATSDVAPAPPRAVGARLLHVGALTPVKDHALLLRALASVRTRGSPATLELVGDGRLRPRLERLVHELDLGQSVHFHGEIDHADLAAVYRAADALVISSRHEAQCMVALEAAACGTQILGTRVGVIPELTSATAPVGDAEALAGAILTILTPQTTSSISERSQLTNLVRSTFGLETCSNRFRELYASLATT
jgi:glycosyltransferase involved in cell wall biosynthesis